MVPNCLLYVNPWALEFTVGGFDSQPYQRNNLGDVMYVPAVPFEQKSDRTVLRARKGVARVGNTPCTSTTCT